MIIVKYVCPSKPWLISPGHFCPAWIPLLFADLPVNCLLENSAYKCKVELIISYPGLLTTHSAAQCRNLGTPSLPSFPLTYNQRTYAINFNISITLGAISSCSSLVLPLELILIHLDIFYRFPIHKQVYLLPNYFLACDPVIFLFQQ